MTEDFLQRIDEQFDAAPRRPLRPMFRRPQAQAATRPEEVNDEQPLDVVETALARRDRLLLEAFVAIQFLWGAMVFLPGAQGYRGYVRALPYLSSLAMLGLFGVLRRHQPFARGSSLMIGALLLLVLNLLHPSSQLNAGLGQCVFQLAIAAPLFWTHKTVRSARELERLLVLIFALNAFSAGLGLLQVYFPERFMPAEFNSLGIEMNQYYVDGLTYVGNDGRLIVRPPGLSDQPGAAATSGAFAAIIGFGLLLRRRNPVVTIGVVSVIAIGFAAIYLSQVRSTLLSTMGAWTLLTIVAIRRGRLASAAWVFSVGGVLVISSFLWASSIAGDSIARRFGTVQGAGALEAYQTGRGIYISETVGSLLDKYPFGAGVGRWGMMNVYFGRRDFGSAPLYVEVQLTGWLLDGGILMWVLYGGATLLAIWMAFRLTRSLHADAAETALTVLALNAFILVLAMAAPVFNTQLGLLFWTMTSALHGAFLNDYRPPADA